MQCDELFSYLIVSTASVVLYLIIIERYIYFVTFAT